MSIEKDPQAKLDYAVDWSAWLQAGETITTSTWTVPAGLSQITPAPSIAAGVTTIWLGGGTLGARYDVVNHIVTSQGREDDRTLHIFVVDR
jgi:hypothetical protein